MAKVNLKHKFIEEGKASSRVVLDYEAGLIYQYHDPDQVKAVYENGSWHLTESPEYHSGGGWGQRSSGDKEGHDTHYNAVNLLRAIEAEALVYNIPYFYDEKEYQDYLKGAEKARKLSDAAKKLGVSSGFEYKFKELKAKDALERYSYWSEKPKKKKRINKGKGINPIESVEKMEKACRVFLDRKGKAINVAGYSISRDEVSQGDTVVAFYDSKGDIFMNSQVLSLTSFERSFLGGRSMVQDQVRKASKFNIPFNVLASANLKLSETKVLEQGPESEHEIKVDAYGSKLETRHFTGALLLENNGRKFLMDIDRIEIEHKIFNVFFVEVDSKAKSIEEAYESMKPKEVKEAENQGIEVKRQGEWFFIKTDKSVEINDSQVHIWSPSEEDKGFKKPRLERFDIAHGKGRPNQLYKPVNFDGLEDLVCGVVSHTGREHKDLCLGITDLESNETQDSMPRRSYSEEEAKSYKFDLWRVVPNTTIGNFTITGDVD